MSRFGLASESLSPRVIFRMSPPVVQNAGPGLICGEPDALVGYFWTGGRVAYLHAACDAIWKQRAREGISAEEGRWHGYGPTSDTAHRTLEVQFTHILSGQSMVSEKKKRAMEYSRDVLKAIARGECQAKSAVPQLLRLWRKVGLLR